MNRSVRTKFQVSLNRAVKYGRGLRRSRRNRQSMDVVVHLVCPWRQCYSRSRVKHQIRGETMPTVQSNGCPIYFEVEGAQDKPVLMFCNSVGTTLHMWDGQMP